MAIQRRLARYLCAAGFGALAAAPASADVIRVFDASGAFLDGVRLGGTLTIDVTIGHVTAANLELGEPIGADLTVLGRAGEIGGGVYQSFFVASGPNAPYPKLDLGFLTPSLIGYDGGALASDATPQGGKVSGYFATAGVDGVPLYFGALTVPEPSTWAMMGLGFAGLGLAGYSAGRKPRAA